MYVQANNINASGQILKDNLFFLASAFSRELVRETDEAFSTVGLSSSHALILCLVDESPGIRPGLLAEKLHLKPSTITRLVQKLERRQLVERESKGRATSIACTAAGSKLAHSLEEQWRMLISQKKEQLGERYVEVLSEMISNALEAMSAEN